MGELPRQLLAWIARLLPKQKVQGDGAIQVGKVEGGMQVVHQHFYPSAPSGYGPSRTDDEKAQAATPEQREVLALMKVLDKPTRYKVLKFMRDSFGTAMVIELLPSQVYRVRRYVETINRRRRDKA